MCLGCELARRIHLELKRVRLDKNANPRHAETPQQPAPFYPTARMTNSKIGFVAVYRWRLHQGKEKQFEAAWERTTLLLRGERGALGSRLHSAADGSWVAYAQWPDKAHWEASQELGSADAEASAAMADAIAESMETLLLEPVNDLLL